MCDNITMILFLAVISLTNAFVPIVEELHAPKPYAFGYKVKDKHGEQHRQEAGDGAGVVKGSYGFTDDRGIHRHVEYVADKAGFRAQIKTNEHGTAPLDPAAVKMVSSAHPYLGGAGHVGVLGPVGFEKYAPALKSEAGILGLGLLAGTAEFKLGGAGVWGEEAPKIKALEGPAFGAGYGVWAPVAPLAGPAGPVTYSGLLKGGEIKGYDSRVGVL